jgi:hemerythrin superfamily protein
MAGSGNSNLKKWGIIAGSIAGGVALISLIPTLKRRAMRVTTILTKDHRVVSGLITTLQMTPRVNGMLRKRLFDQIRTQVMVHATAEEEILYPAMRNLMFMHGASRVDESYREHQQIKDLLNEMSGMDTTTEAFDWRFQDFKNKIVRHVEQEEEVMFPIVRERMSTERQEDLGQKIHDRKMQLKPRMAA